MNPESSSRRKISRICIVPQTEGVGGMVSFRHKMVAGLVERGIEACYSLSDTPYDSVLVIGGTRDLLGLRKARRQGIPVIQRLNGMNWLHRKRKTGLKHYLRSEYGNLLLAWIRSRVATGIVYQSEFSRNWWEHEYGMEDVPHRIQYNGVDLNTYTPDGPHRRPADHYRLLLVEGTIGGGYEMGLETAGELARRLQDTYHLPVELVVAGRVSEAVQAEWQRRLGNLIHFAGLLPRAEIPELDRSAHLLYSADLNAACPNSVIEALSCGLPVVAFDTGALAELVKDDAGRVVSYGGDPWKLDPPDVPSLADAAVEVLQDQERFRKAARQRAGAKFGLDSMVDGYLEALSAE